MAAKSEKSAKGGKSKKAGKKTGKKTGKKATSRGTRFDIEIKDDRVVMTVFHGGTRKLSVAAAEKGPPIKKGGKGPPVK